MMKYLSAALIGAAAGVAAYFIAKKANGKAVLHTQDPEEVESAGSVTDDAPVSQPEPETAGPVEEDLPNPNPVTLGTADAPIKEDGTLDATKIADPADFGDWDDQGCKG